MRYQELLPYPNPKEIQEMEMFFVLRDITHAFLGFDPNIPPSEISRAINSTNTPNEASCALRLNFPSKYFSISP